MVEDHPHRSALPNLTLAAHLTHRLLQSLLEEPSLHVLTRVRGVLHQNLVQGPCRQTKVPLDAFRLIEVIDRYLPNLCVFLQHAPSPATRAESKLAQALRPRVGGCDRLPGLLLRIAKRSPCHTGSMSNAADGKLRLGSPGSNRERVIQSDQCCLLHHSPRGRPSLRGSPLILRRPRHLAAFRARLHRRAAGGGDPQDAHRFEA